MARSECGRWIAREGRDSTGNIDPRMKTKKNFCFSTMSLAPPNQPHSWNIKCNIMEFARRIKLPSITMLWRKMKWNLRIIVLNLRIRSNSQWANISEFREVFSRDLNAAWKLFIQHHLESALKAFERKFLFDAALKNFYFSAAEENFT